MARSRTCTAFERCLPRFRARALEPDEHARHAAHLEGCTSCRQVLAADEALDASLRQASAPSLGAAGAERLSESLATLAQPTPLPTRTPIPWKVVAVCGGGLLLALAADLRLGSAPPPPPPLPAPPTDRNSEIELPQEDLDLPSGGPLSPSPSGGLSLRPSRT